MTRGRRVPVREFLDVPLEVHRVLADVPLRDVTAIELPGGGVGRTLSDVSGFQNGLPRGGPVTRALFRLRGVLGRLFGWDSARHDRPEASYRSRLPPELVARSRQVPGSKSGPFHFLYQLDTEALLEIRNATVHAFLCTALRPTDTGYQFFWAVYVVPVSWTTPFYMALIEPFRRFIVYPSLFRSVARAWQKRYAPSPSGRDSQGLEGGPA